MFIILFVSTILTLSALAPSAAHGASDFAVITNSSSSLMAEESPHQRNTPTFPPINSKNAWIESGLCNMYKLVDQLKSSPLPCCSLGSPLPCPHHHLRSKSLGNLGMKQSRISLRPLHSSNDWHHSSYDGFKCCWRLVWLLLVPLHKAAEP